MFKQNNNDDSLSRKNKNKQQSTPTKYKNIENEGKKRKQKKLRQKQITWRDFPQSKSFLLDPLFPASECSLFIHSFFECLIKLKFVFRLLLIVVSVLTFVCLQATHPANNPSQLKYQVHGAVLFG